MSQTERSVATPLKEMLVNNEPFQYAHLVKFERPSRPDALTGKSSTSKQRYTYLTDASINVTFDDGSYDLEGNANGSQVYIANKVLSIGPVTEQMEATANQTSITLDGNMLGAYLEATVDIDAVDASTWDIELKAPVTINDAINQGFREGDKISVSGTLVNIHSFRSGNIIRVKKIDTDMEPSANAPVTISLNSEEIISILLNKNSVDYASFINREVFIYRAYFQEGVIVGSPIPLFKGIIQNVNFSDDENKVVVTWGLTSHWGDFQQVRGRVTSDEAHRALDQSGAPQPTSALKPIYAYDKGFIHAENSIHMLAKYTTLVEHIEVKTKSGFLGLFAKTKVKKEWIPEDRYTDLDFQLAAKAIPIIYGVRVAEGIPVFADTLNDDSSTVFIVSVLCEGEIGGIYDMYVEGTSLICIDESDYDARSEDVTRTTEANEAIEMFCRGRADRGDALGGAVSTDINTPISFYIDGVGSVSIANIDITNAIAEYYGAAYVPPTDATSQSYGLLDGESISLTSPQTMSFDVFTGKPGQKASAQLSEIAYNNNFKVQNDYWEGPDTSEYWGPNHRLLDTAYVIGKYKIQEGETTIPEVKFVVRGKLIECYNYDYSFLHDPKASSESADNFPLGSTVSLYQANGTLIHSNVQIIDKWTFYNPDGTPNVRFRFSVDPNLSWDTENKAGITKFYMQNGSSQTWTMVAHNYKSYSGTVSTHISSEVTGTSDSGGKLAINYTSNSDFTVDGDPINATAKFIFTDNSLVRPSAGRFTPYAVISGTSISATSITTPYAYSTYGAVDGINSPTGLRLASANTIKLSGASGTADFYKGDIIKVTRIDSVTGKALVQEAEIIGYDGSTGIATIDTIWDFIPIGGDTVEITHKYNDKRVSINTAIQTLDYVTSKTYGLGLDPYKDLYLPSWTETARTKCDMQADVTVHSATTGVSAGDVYKYPASGNIIWQGTVSSASSTTLGYLITFTDVIGKLTNKWNSWKYYNLNEIVYHDNNRYVVTSPGVKATAPVHTSGDVGGLLYTTGEVLTKVSGAGPATLTLGSESNPIFGIKKGKKISGYSTYDCDDINYWRMCGWDEHAQRYATKYQSNLAINPSGTIFDNTNALLEHFNGILRYTAGKYYLDAEEVADTINTTDVRTITTDDIIGKISLSDEGTRSSYNSLTAAFADPAIKFEARNVSFFNSDYLRADRNVPKKGNLSIPGITNYYNTRILADSYLNKSRFGLTINMTIRPHGVLLLAGSIIQVIYPRYGSEWESPGKKFRIFTITYRPDGLCDIVAKEYDDSFYSMNSVGGGGGALAGGNAPNSNVLAGPTNLIVTSADTADELLNGVELFWDNNPVLLDNPNAHTEIYGSLTDKIFVYVSTIDASNVLTTTFDHGLVPGMPVYPVEDANGLLTANIYYVLDTPTLSTFRLTDTKNGVTPVTLTEGTDLLVKIRTATLLATLPIPARSYVDGIVNEGTNAVEKYYWVRHKIIRT